MNVVVSHSVRIGFSVLAAFALVAVPLALLGAFGPATVVIGTAAFAVPVAWAVGSEPFELECSQLATTVVILVVGAVTIVGVLHPTQHFATGRDPGVYATTAIWMAENGDLDFAGVPEEFRDVEGLVADGSGFQTAPGGKNYPQGLHLTPALLASADLLGDLRAAVRVNLIVGALGLLALFVLAQRLMHSWPAVLTTTALAVCLPQVHFARGPFSEPLSQALVLGGLVVLTGCSRPRARPYLVAGLLMGAVAGTRIDGIVVLGAAIVTLTYLIVHHGQGRDSLRAAGWFTAGAVTTAAIGMVDLMVASPEYLGDLSDEVRRAAMGTIGLTVLCAVFLGLRPARRRLGPLLSRRRGALALIACISVGVVLLGLLFVRPLVDEDHFPATGFTGGLQEREGLEVEPTRRYGEESLLRMTWYFGWPLVLASIAGAAVATRRAIGGRDARSAVVLIALGIPTLVYLWRPSIFPDHIWAMRRHVPYALPLLVLMAGVALDGACNLVRRTPRPWAIETRADVIVTATVVASAVMFLVPTMRVTEPFWDERVHQLSIQELDAICGAVGEGPVLVDKVDLLDRQFVQPIAARCGAVVASGDLTDVAVLADAVDAVGGDGLLILTARPDELPADTLPVAQVDTVIQRPEFTINRPPSTAGTWPKPVTIVEVVTPHA